MKPYYQDEAVTIYHGDCLEVAPSLGTFDVILTDPPYGKVKGDFDHQWANRPAMLNDCARWLDMMRGAMKPNATLWWFAWPSLAGRIEAMIAEHLCPLAHVVWLKPFAFAHKQSPQALRAPAPETERILMAEHYGANGGALGVSGFKRNCDEARGFIFEPLRKYLSDECAAAGWTASRIDGEWKAQKGNKGGMSGHWLGVSQWALPTEANYEWLRATVNGCGEYKHLRREYEDLRREYEGLRRYFKLATSDQKTDVWRFSPSGNGNGHPTEKPLDLISYMARISCRPGGTILDPFAGSGTTGRAAKDLGKRAVLIEREERYCEIAAKRMAQEVLPLAESGLTSAGVRGVPLFPGENASVA